MEKPAVSNTDLTIPAVLDRTGSLPAMVRKAANTLASATSAAEVLDARDQASVAYDAAKRAARIAKAKEAHDELVAKVTRAQADALEIEVQAKRRLADEYDAAQERGELAKAGNPNFSRTEKIASGTGIIPPKDLHEARILRNAEQTDPGVVRRTIEEAIQSGEEPTRAKVRRAALRTVRPVDDAPAARPARGKAAITARVREAIAALSGLPPPAEVVGFLRGTDEAVIVDEALPTATRWLSEFSDLWGDDPC